MSGLQEPQVLGLRTGFAVVDVETTGFSPRTNRILEIAVVQLDESLQVEDEFVTVIDPGRDVGPVSVHGITATDVVGAPTFADAAGEIAARLAGRVVVAHNARFDAQFLLAEFGRLGYLLPELVTMCTMQLADSYFPHAPSRRLADCCTTAGVEQGPAHLAGSDAHAAAGLLRRYAEAHTSSPPSWVEALTQAALSPWPPVPRAPCRPLTRDAARARRESEVPYLATLVARLPRFGSGAQLQPYLAVLDRALEDRLVTDVEVVQLAELAQDLGLSQDLVAAGHRTYLGQLAVAAWADGQVTDSEMSDLRRVAHLLGILVGEVDAALEWARSASEAAAVEVDVVDASDLHVGDSVVFTGECDLPRDELESRARHAGLLAKSSVSRKTNLLVIADPNSQSGKARRARELGIRIVSEPVFLSLLGRIAPAPRAIASSVPAPEPDRAMRIEA